MRQRIHPGLTVDFNDDMSIHALCFTRPNGAVSAVLNDHVYDLRSLFNELQNLFETERTERERNALASSALDSIEAGTAPEEASAIPFPPLLHRFNQSQQDPVGSWEHE